MPRVINDSELTTGLTKARPVVIPDRMPITTLNLDLDGGAEKANKPFRKKAILVTIKQFGGGRRGGDQVTGTNMKLK